MLSRLDTKTEKNKLTLASPKGGQPPIDPQSDLPEHQPPAMMRFKRDTEAQRPLSQTLELSGMKSEDFDTIFYLGGHGPMWDLVDRPDSIALIEPFYNSDKPVAAVRHSRAVFHRVMYHGGPLVKGKRVTGFINGEEAAVNLSHVVPFLVEDGLKSIGGLHGKAADWLPFAWSLPHEARANQASESQLSTMPIAFIEKDLNQSRTPTGGVMGRVDGRTRSRGAVAMRLNPL